MATTLYIVRHGETEGSKEKQYKGSIDVPLSPNGIEQMKRSAAFITAEVQRNPHAKAGAGDYTKIIEDADAHSSTLAAVYCSPLSRAKKSAEIIAAPFGLEPIVIEELRERSFGVWEGMTFSQIAAAYPDEFDKWRENPLEHSPIGGESTYEVRGRVLRALEKILEKHKAASDGGPQIAIVAHGGVNRVLLCHFLGVPLEHIFRIEQDFAAVNIIELWDDYPLTKLLNWRDRG